MSSFQYVSTYVPRSNTYGLYYVAYPRCKHALLWIGSWYVYRSSSQTYPLFSRKSTKHALPGMVVLQSKHVPPTSRDLISRLQVPPGEYIPGNMSNTADNFFGIEASPTGICRFMSSSQSPPGDYVLLSMCSILPVRSSRAGWRFRD